jgi:hypothetical protein
LVYIKPLLWLNNFYSWDVVEGWPLRALPINCDKVNLPKAGKRS